MLFYKGLFNFLLGKYEEAGKLFTQSKTVKVLNKQLSFLEGQKHGDSKESKGKSYKRSASDEKFENNIYSAEEIEYNIGICDLLSGNMKSAQKKFSYFPGLERLFSPV